MSWQLYEGWNGTRHGNWSTFKLRVGSPPQILPALPSAPNSWMYLPFDKPYEEPPQCIGTVPGQSFECTKHGTWASTPLYNPCDSSTSRNTGDCLSFSDWFDDGHPELHSSILGSRVLANGTIFASHEKELAVHPEYFRTTAMIGMLPVLHIHNLDESYKERVLTPGSPETQKADSIFQGFPQMYLHDKTHPLDLVWAYTAGAWYRDYPGSFTIGATDPTRIGDDSRRYQISGYALWPTRGLSDRFHHILEIQIESLTASGVLHKPWFPRSNYMDWWTVKRRTFLDPEFPQLALPVATCERLAHDFGLEYNKYEEDPIFWVSDETRARLRELRPTFTLRIRPAFNFEGPNPPIDIELPYEAFEHDITDPDGTKRAYFPIRMSRRSDRLVLGRVFFQEVYLAVDWFDFHFNLSKAAFPEPRRFGDDHLQFWNRPQWDDDPNPPQHEPEPVQPPDGQPEPDEPGHVNPEPDEPNHDHPNPHEPGHDMPDGDDPPEANPPESPHNPSEGHGPPLLPEPDDNPFTGIRRFKLLLETIRGAAITVLIIVCVHGLLPLLLGLPKYIVLGLRRRTQERIWIAEHAEGWPAVTGLINHRRRGNVA